MSLRTERSDGTFSYSAILNANLSGRDLGIESLVLEYATYDDGVTGIHFAPLDFYDMGYGLFVNDMSTHMYQPSFQRNDQNALMFDRDLDWCNVEAFGTASHLYGGEVSGITLAGMNFGLEWVSDSRMTSSEGFGRSGLGLMAEIPLNDLLSIIGESASTSNGGEGTLAGISLGHNMMVAFTKLTVAAVSFNDKFVPGYFTTGYDVDPIDFSSLESSSSRRYGTMVSMDTSVMGLFDLDLTSENYSDGGSANSGKVFITPSDKFSFTAFVKQLSFDELRPTARGDSDFAGGSLRYRLNDTTSLNYNYLKTPSIETLKSYDTSYLTLSFEF